MTSAFISHHSGQHETARTLKAALARAGVDGWMAPDDIAPGVTFDQAIIDQIGRSDFVVLLLCRNADQSRHVKRELMIAEDAGKPVYPVRLEPLEPKGLAYWLKDTQWTDWFGRDAPGADRLVAAIQRGPTIGTAASHSLAPQPGRGRRRLILLAVGTALVIGAAAGGAARFFWGARAPDYVIRPGQWTARREVVEILYPQMAPEGAQQIEQMFENDPNPEECVSEAVARAPDVRLFDPRGEGNCALRSFQIGGGRISGYLTCPMAGANDGSAVQITFRGTYTPTRIEMDNDVTFARPDNMIRLRAREITEWVRPECGPGQQGSNG